MNNNKNRRHNLQRLALASLIAALSGCAALQTYKSSEETVEVSQDTITNTMPLLLQKVRELDRLSNSEHTEETRQNAISQLESMQTLTQNLGAGKHITNHLQLDKHIHQLNADIETARLALTRNPPSYYWVGRISGSCIVCHTSPVKQ